MYVHIEKKGTCGLQPIGDKRTREEKDEREGRCGGNCWETTLASELHTYGPVAIEFN